MSELRNVCDVKKALDQRAFFQEKETRLQEDAAHRVPRGQRACKARYLPLFLIETVFATVPFSPVASVTVSTTVTL